MMPEPVLTIVVGGPPSEGGSAQLAAFRSHLASEPVELILCGGPAATSFEAPQGWRVVRSPPTVGMELVPACWGVGLRLARAPLVAFFSGDTIPTADWWPRLRDALADPMVAAAAGGIIPHAEVSLDRAVFLCRYSAFMPRHGAEVIDTDALPGEATVYRRAALLSDPRLSDPAEGFWEVAHHHRLLQGGWRLRWLDEPLALFVGRPGFVAFMQQRFLHARRFGAERVASGVSRFGLLLRAPAVPAVMLSRVLRRAASSRAGRRALPGALPRLAMYLSGWALGEAVGAWRGSDG